MEFQREHKIKALSVIFARFVKDLCKHIRQFPFENLFDDCNGDVKEGKNTLEIIYLCPNTNSNV